jgi:hypothetical protein
MAVQSMAAAIPVAAAGTVYTGTAELRGFSLRTASASTVTVYDNTAASGTVLASFDTAAGALAQTLVIPGGLRAATGLHVACAVGVTGSVWIA